MSQQRSGTHYLESLLTSNRAVRSFGEVINGTASNYNFYSHMAHLAAKDPGVVFPSGWKRAWQSFTDSLDVVPGTECGFILMYNQLSLLPPHVETLILGQIRPIHLVRENVLRTHVSDAINRLRVKPAHQRDRPGDAVAIELPVATLVPDLTVRTEQIQAMRTRLSDRLHLEFVYEQMVADEQGEADRAFTFLGVQPVQVASRFQRSNPQPLSEILVNYGEVADTLRGTVFAPMLEA